MYMCSSTATATLGQAAELKARAFVVRHLVTAVPCMLPAVPHLRMVQPSASCSTQSPCRTGRRPALRSECTALQLCSVTWRLLVTQAKHGDTEQAGRPSAAAGVKSGVQA